MSFQKDRLNCCNTTPPPPPVPVTVMDLVWEQSVLAVIHEVKSSHTTGSWAFNPK